MAWISNLTVVYFNNLLDLHGRWHCPSTIIWMFCTIAAFCVDDLVVTVSFILPDCLDLYSAYCKICHHFRQHGCSTRACMGPWVPSLAVFLLGYLGPVPGCFLRVHLFRVLLLTSWLTASLTPFSDRSPRSGSCFVLVAHVADFFFCTSLLRRFLVSTRARHPRSLASSRLTATLCSSSSPFHHFRAASCSTSRLVCSSSIAV